MPYSRPHSRPARRAFTLVEVMMAVAVMAVGLGAALKFVYEQQGQRRLTRDMINLDALARAMAERIESADLEQLGRDETAQADGTEWSLPREAIWLDEAALQANGFTSWPTGLKRVQVTLRFYRGETELDPNTGLPVAGRRGLLSGPAATQSTYATPADFRTAFTGDAAFTTEARINPPAWASGETWETVLNRTNSLVVYFRLATEDGLVREHFASRMVQVEE